MLSILGDNDEPSFHQLSQCYEEIPPLLVRQPTFKFWSFHFCHHSARNPSCSNLLMQENIAKVTCYPWSVHQPFLPELLLSQTAHFSLAQTNQLFPNPSSLHLQLHNFCWLVWRWILVVGFHRQSNIQSVRCLKSTDEFPCASFYFTNYSKTGFFSPLRKIFYQLKWEKTDGKQYVSNM